MQPCAKIPVPLSSRKEQKASRSGSRLRILVAFYLPHQYRQIAGPALADNGSGGDKKAWRNRQPRSLVPWWADEDHGLGAQLVKPPMRVIWNKMSGEHPMLLVVQCRNFLQQNYQRITKCSSFGNNFVWVEHLPPLSRGNAPNSGGRQLRAPDSKIGCYKLMRLGQRLLGKRLFRTLMRHTFYGHFVGGESASSIQPLLERLRSFGVKSILDYSAEEDLSEQEAKEAEMAACSPQAPTKEESPPPGGHLKQFQPSEQFADRRHPHVMARTYFYLNEAQCEKNMDIFLKCIDAVAGATEGTGLAAIKLTALGRPQLLMQLSEVVVHTRKFFQEVTGADQAMALSSVDPSVIAKKVEVSPADQEAFHRWLDRMDYDRKGLMNIFSWSGLVDTNYFISDLFKVPNLKTGRMEPIISALSEEEEEMFRNMMRRIHTIAKAARTRDVRVMVDAEQSYFQPAISRITMELMRKYNKDKAIVFNTYQCYLRATYDHVVRDLELARRQNFFFGAKLVRGAYLEQERLRARTLGYEDPVNATYEDTNAMYHRTLTECLRQVVEGKERRAIAIMVASHNEDTIRFTVNKMQELGIRPDDRVVCFGQLLGMCDQVSFPLGQAGYSVYKYVPYGPIDEVMPYLSRRAIENNSLLQKVSKELGLLRHELTRRLLTAQLWYTPRGHYKPV